MELPIYPIPHQHTLQHVQLGRARTKLLVQLPNSTCEHMKNGCGSCGGKGEEGWEQAPACRAGISIVLPPSKCSTNWHLSPGAAGRALRAACGMKRLHVERISCEVPLNRTR